MILRIVFLGSDAIALPALDWLAGQGSATAEIVAVATQPDRPAAASRSRAMRSSAGPRREACRSTSRRNWAKPTRRGSPRSSPTSRW